MGCTGTPRPGTGTRSCALTWSAAPGGRDEPVFPLAAGLEKPVTLPRGQLASGPPPPAAHDLRPTQDMTARGGTVAAQTGRPFTGCPSPPRGARPGCQARRSPGWRGRDERDQGEACSMGTQGPGGLRSHDDRATLPGAWAPWGHGPEPVGRPLGKALALRRDPEGPLQGQRTGSWFIPPGGAGEGTGAASPAATCPAPLGEGRPCGLSSSLGARSPWADPGLHPHHPGTQGSPFLGLVSSSVRRAQWQLLPGVSPWPGPSHRHRCRDPAPPQPPSPASLPSLPGPWWAHL